MHSVSVVVVVDTAVVVVGNTGGDGGDYLTAAVAVLTPIWVELLRIELLESCCREKIGVVVVVAVNVATLTLLMPLAIFFQCQLSLARSQLLLEHSS